MVWSQVLTSFSLLIMVLHNWWNECCS